MNKFGKQVYNLRKKNKCIPKKENYTYCYEKYLYNEFFRD